MVGGSGGGGGGHGGWSGGAEPEVEEKASTININK